ncbi:predicted protein [Phaeodactylum tricornutum CCAP 1055/1]|uniref:AAA+ ATPase domain-containing protein n=3 Tax=Phaeodactylum tricornutum TaxID=2850 RepID=B7FR99_PHATC|nr:predicted protein [Phaeodactylum tricornutum CCAP 1055/1]EEC50971.1 predicted protein [Phaeodactylum tricornutum CCAP 1055/1]|eukprot:XP_002176508.1 predicted protein [Phaeodactylum tricornutum CCAP 1055/1]
MASSMSMNETGASPSSGGAVPTTGDFVDLHELSKGWKAAITRAKDPSTRYEARVKNDRGNLPLHSAASFRAPLEVAEALLAAYPEAASITNNYGNLALHFTAWKKGPLDVEQLLLKRDGMTEEREMVLAMLMDMKENHPHALYSAGIDPKAVTDLDSMLEQVRKASVEETIPPGSSDEEIDAQLIEESLCPPDDPVEVALAGVIGCSAVKNQIRGLRRTIEIAAATGEVSKIPRHLAFIGNPGTGKTMVARKMVNILRNVGAIQSLNFVEVGREDLIDKKSEARTVFKTRKVLERAAGGVLFVDEAYTLLPSTARPRGRDHGAAALREIARALPGGNPLVILTGAPLDLQRVLSSDIGFKGHFLTRIEFPDATPLQIAHMFMAKLSEKGLMPAQGVTPQYLGELIKSNTEAEWRQERNGRIADLLLLGVRAEVKKRAVWDDTASKGSLSPMKILSPGSSRMPAFAPEEVFVNVEDIQNAIVNGM